jgi:nitrogen fixation-related uncharacterized protein
MLLTRLRRREENDVTTYYPFWVLLIALSLWASLGGFFWAYRHRQFTDQKRAGYLPLRGEAARASSGPGQHVSREVIAMCAVLGIGVAAILLTIVTVILGKMGTGL